MTGNSFQWKKISVMRNTLLYPPLNKCSEIDLLFLDLWLSKLLQARRGCSTMTSDHWFQPFWHQQSLRGNPKFIWPFRSLWIWITWQITRRYTYFANKTFRENILRTEGTPKETTCLEFSKSWWLQCQWWNMGCF